jgi:hypothetical protein
MTRSTKTGVAELGLHTNDEYNLIPLLNNICQPFKGCLALKGNHVISVEMNHSFSKQIPYRISFVEGQEIFHVVVIGFWNFCSFIKIVES